MHILSPVTDNCPSWISGRERMAVEIISWPISTKESYRAWGSHPRPSPYQADAHLTELARLAYSCVMITKLIWFLYGTLSWNSYNLNETHTKTYLVSIKNINHKKTTLKILFPYRFLCFQSFYWTTKSDQSLLYEPVYGNCDQVRQAGLLSYRD